MAKILVVDDEFGIGELLRDLLSEENHDVVLALNGRQGLILMEREKPDLVFLDFMMPVLDGAGVLREKARDPAIAGIPVVMMSSLPEHSVTDRVQGIVAYMHKPFRIAAVLDLLGSLLEPGPQAG